MNLQELVELQESNQWIFLGILGALPLLTLIVGFMGRGEIADSPLRYIYSLIVYAATLPGMLALAACIHLFFFDGGNFMEVNIFIYFLPIVLMGITLSLMSRFVRLSKVPGFGQITGLLMVAGVLGLTLFFLKRTYIGIIFFGSIWTLLGFFGILVVLFVVGSRLLRGKRID